MTYVLLASASDTTHPGTSADDYLKTTTGIVDWLLETGGAPKEGQPQAPLHIAFGTTLNYYSWLEQPGSEHRLARFGHAMNGSRQWEVAENVLGGMCMFLIASRVF